MKQIDETLDWLEKEARGLLEDAELAKQQGWSRDYIQLRLVESSRYSKAAEVIKNLLRRVL